ncbi:MAG TPA: hypothetical protein PKA27_00195 [Fimbriimonadaceae bacterium]|nr:hypothetical protein [Fimbriimonadaceae bacterium]
MLRIVGVQRNESPEREFILLQNQGSMRVNLRGHVLMSEQALDSGSLYATSHVFQDDVHIMPSAYVLLFTGCGESRWTRSKEGSNVYQAYMGQDRTIWSRLEGAIHIMHAHHVFVERDHLIMRR